MSRGSCLIDGIDIADFGMFILKDSDYDFLSFPTRKEPQQNNWPEYDGVDADLSEIYFKEKKVTPRFYIKAETAGQFIDNLNTFYDLISAPGYRQLYSREFDKTFSLRYITCPDYLHKGGLYKEGIKRGELDVEFSMDDPLQIFTDNSILSPSLFGSFLLNEDGSFSGTEDDFFVDLGDAVIRNHSRVKINGYDLSEFGIVVNQCYNTVLKMPAVKQPLTRSFERRSGLLAYTKRERTFDVKQIVIDCTMLSGSRYEFYYNYEALFNNISKTGELTISTYTGDVACYYSAMQNFKKLRPFNSRILVTFSLVFTLLHPGIIRYVLATEDGAYITTENEYLIIV